MKKTILITGAGSGIGKGTAFALAARGHHVLATTHTDEQAAVLTREAAAQGVALEIFTLDITKTEDRAKAGEYDIDVLVNNAGMGETGSLAEVPMERVRENFEVNVFSALELTQLVLKGMMKKKQGTVVFVSSLAGRVPIPFLNPYSMTKFALSGGVAALRSELHRIAPNVQVSLIEPGTYATGFNQRMLAKKYEWMDESSYFHSIISELKREDHTRFALAEEKDIASIVKRIVSACEARAPRLRYIAPRYQGLGVRLLRIFGV